MKYIDTNIDAITGEVTVTERDFTADEIKAQKLSQEKDLQRQAEAATKATQRQALLTRLGITEEEARILLGGN